MLDKLIARSAALAATVAGVAAAFTDFLSAATPSRLARALQTRWWPWRREAAAPGKPLAGGRMVGPYRIGRQLGRGASGVVYLGQDVRSGRPAAVKTIRLPLASAGSRPAADAARARFLAEARVAAGLHHPHIVAILEAGVAGDIGFIAMEVVTGTDLGAHVLPGRLLPVATVLRIGAQCARALAHAHRQGVVHRDIKPANLLWAGGANGAGVKLTDFGIARITEQAAWRTQTGQLLGSPAYMSPEQLGGREVDGRTDLYALGVLLFQMLTGELPHRAASLGGLMHAIAHQPAADLRSLRPDLPPAVADIVARALQKQPQGRHPDGDRMADDLAAAAAGPTIGFPASNQGTIPAFDDDTARRPTRSVPMPAHPASSLSLDFFCATDTGRARSNNEDAVAVDETTLLAVLADGMGGYNAGEVASSMATSFIKSELGRWLAEAADNATDADVRRAMEICVENANRAIYNAAYSNPQYAGMGTTLVVGVFRDTRLLVGHVGDSRAYRMRLDKLVQITHDHSLLQEQIDSGLITPEQAAFSANKNLVTRAVGVEDTVMLETHLHEVMAGDVYLLCSDGLSDMLDDERISQVLSANSTLAEAAQALVDAANDAGGRDNISVVLARVRAVPSPPQRSWWPFRR